MNQEFTYYGSKETRRWWKDLTWLARRETIEANHAEALATNEMTGANR